MHQIIIAIFWILHIFKTTCTVLSHLRLNCFVVQDYHACRNCITLCRNQVFLFGAYALKNLATFHLCACFVFTFCSQWGRLFFFAIFGRCRNSGGMLSCGAAPLCCAQKFVFKYVWPFTWCWCTWYTDQQYGRSCGNMVVHILSKTDAFVVCLLKFFHALSDNENAWIFGLVCNQYNVHAKMNSEVF